MSKVTFGGEGTLRIYKRFNTEEAITLTFKDANGDPYIFSPNLFTFNVRKNIKNSPVLFTVNSTNGLSLSSNELAITITATNSNLAIGEYYYQLLYDGDVKLNGTFVVYDRSVEAIN